MGEIRKDYSPTLSSPRITFGPDGKPQISRRFALRAAGTALLGLALSGCALQPTPVAAPAATAVPTAGESARQATAEPTIAPQALLVSPEPAKPQRPPITANMLKKGLTGIGGPTGVEPILVPTQDPPPTEVPTAEKGVDIFSQARILFRASPIDFAVPHGGKDAEFQQINATGLNALKYIVAELSTYGMEGLNIDLEPSFLNNLDLLVARLKLGKLTMGEVSPPSLKLQSPANGLTIHRDTNMTIIGEANTHALVSFSDSTRGDNCEFIALIGQEELADLLRQNGYQLAGNEQGGLVISQDGSGILHPVQQIKDDKFIQKEIIPEMGATFVDELINAGKTSAHPFPVVPFPDAGIFSSPTDPTALKYQTSPDGRTVTAVDADGKILAIATYNPQKVNDPLSPEVAAWEWKKYEAPQWYESKDMEVRRKGVEAWANSITYEGYSEKDIAELKTVLIKYLPYVHTSPLTVFPWYSKFPYDFPENPLAYLECVRIISNWDGKGTFNEPNIQAVRLDRTMFANKTDEPKVEWVALIMKEAMLNAISGKAKQAVADEKAAHNRQDTSTAIFLSNFYRNNPNRHDLGTVSAAIVVRTDLVNAKILTKPEKTTVFITEQLQQINDEAKKQGWTVETPWK